MRRRRENPVGLNAALTGGAWQQCQVRMRMCVCACVCVCVCLSVCVCVLRYIEESERREEGIVLWVVLVAVSDSLPLSLPLSLSIAAAQHLKKAPQQRRRAAVQRREDVRPAAGPATDAAQPRHCGGPSRSRSLRAAAAERLREEDEGARDVGEGEVGERRERSRGRKKAEERRREKMEKVAN